MIKFISGDGVLLNTIKHFKKSKKDELAQKILEKILNYLIDQSYDFYILWNAMEKDKKFELSQDLFDIITEEIKDKT